MRLSLHFCPSRPTVRWRPANLTTCESTYCRLSSTNCFSDSWRPRAGSESRHDGIRSSPRCKTFQGSKLILVEIATTRLIQRRVISYRLLVKVKILGETSVKETVLQQTLLPAALSFSLIGLSHEPGALGIIIYPRKGSVRFS